MISFSSFFSPKSLTVVVCLFIIFGCTGSLLLCAAFSSCSKPGLFFIAVASLAAEHRH